MIDFVDGFARDRWGPMTDCCEKPGNDADGFCEREFHDCGVGDGAGKWYEMVARRKPRHLI
jgi:hypothetical protein